MSFLRRYPQSFIDSIISPDIGIRERLAIVPARASILGHLAAFYGRVLGPTFGRIFSGPEIVQPRILEPIHPLLSQENACIAGWQNNIIPEHSKLRLRLAVLNEWVVVGVTINARTLFL